MGAAGGGSELEVRTAVHTLARVRQTAAGSRHTAQGSQLGALDGPEEWGAADGREAQERGVCVYIQLAHSAQQKLTQRCKVIILQ